jgi:hypothetical protein
MLMSKDTKEWLQCAGIAVLAIFTFAIWFNHDAISSSYRGAQMFVGCDRGISCFGAY